MYKSKSKAEKSTFYHIFIPESWGSDHFHEKDLDLFKSHVNFRKDSGEGITRRWFANQEERPGYPIRSLIFFLIKQKGGI